MKKLGVPTAGPSVVASYEGMSINIILNDSIDYHTLDLFIESAKNKQLKKTFKRR